VLANNLPRGVFVEPTVLQAAEGGCGQPGSILAEQRRQRASEKSPVEIPFR
jgi:hypothetical protein